MTTVARFTLVAGAVAVAAWSGLAYGAFRWWIDRVDDLEAYIAETVETDAS